MTQPQPKDSTTKRLCRHVAAPGEPPGSASQSLRMSNACGSGEFFYQTYSPQESYRSARSGSIRCSSPSSRLCPRRPTYQPGLFLSVSPDSGEGSRMSWVGLEDTSAGIQVSAADTPEVDGKFADYALPLLDRTSPHTIRFWIKVNPGADNDLVRIAIDGRGPSVSASRRGRTTTAPLRSRRRRRTPIRQRTSTACSSAPACRGPLPSPVVATCSTT